MRRASRGHRGKATPAWRSRSRLAFVLSAAMLGVIVAGTTLVGPLADSAAAHATLLETSPADDSVLERAPEQVELVFDEGVDVAPGGVRVLDRAGDRVDEGVARTSEGSTRVTVPIDSTAQGTFTVAWRALSNDGHNLAGSFVFHVGTRTGAVAVDEGDDALVEVVAGVARGLALAGAIVLIGSALIAVRTSSETAMSDRLRALMVASGAVGALAVVGLLVTQAATASGRSMPGAITLTWDVAVGTRTGVLLLWRLALLALATAFAVIRGRWGPVLVVMAGAASMIFTSAGGHAWTAEHRIRALTADVAHLWAVSVWVGGLVALTFALRLARDRVAVVSAFSVLAVVAVALVAASGTVSSIEQVGSWAALTGTGYGRLLMIKVAGFVALVGFGWVNRTRLIAGVARAPDAFLRSMRAEVTVAGAVLVVTAILVGQPPARATFSEPFDTTVTSTDLLVQVTVQPARAGANEMHLYFFEADGRSFAAIDAVEITAAVGDIPPRRLDVTPISPSHVSVYGASLAAAGTWAFTITAVRAGQPSTLRFEVPIR